MAKDIDLSKYTNLFKTKKVLQDMEDSEKEFWKEILRYYWPKIPKPSPKKSWKLLADRVFSEYDRLYYADKYGYVRCITSWLKMKRNDKRCQCWHFVKRNVEKYRYDILNCYPQCYRDNVELEGNYPIYTLKMIDMHGRKKVEYMLNDKQTVEHWMTRYQKQIKERYKFITEKKEQISKMSKESDTDLENMEF